MEQEISESIQRGRLNPSLRLCVMLLALACSIKKTHNLEYLFLLHLGQKWLPLLHCVKPSPVHIRQSLCIDMRAPLKEWKKNVLFLDPKRILTIEQFSAHRAIVHAHKFRLLGNSPGENRASQCPFESGLDGVSQSPWLQLIISKVSDLRQRHWNSNTYTVKLFRTIPWHWVQDS